MPSLEKPPRRFALVGKSGAGKSTVARLINQYCGASRISTGAICREIARLLFGNDSKGNTQRLDDALTTIDPSIFLRAALRDASVSDPICVDALRFNSDLVLAREHKLVVIKVVASEAVRHARLVARGQAFDPSVDGVHRSETELDDATVDHIIENNGDGLGAVEATIRALCVGNA